MRARQRKSARKPQNLALHAWPAAAWAKADQRLTRRSAPESGHHCPSSAKRVVFGAIDLRTARRVVLIRNRAGQLDAQAFLRELHRRYRHAGQIWLLADRASAHTAPRTLALAARLRIRFPWLPKQTPELRA